MTEIPADVMQAAEQTANLIIDGLNVSRGAGGRTSPAVVNTIALAIMAERERFMNEFEGAADSGIDAAVEAERERCAKIAESYSNSAHIAYDMGNGIFPNRSRIQDVIATKIRDSQP